MCVHTVAKWPAARVAIQPPSVEYSNDWGKWRSVRPCSAELALEIGAERASLDARRARHGVDLEHAIERRRSIETAPLYTEPTSRADAADDRGASAERDRGDALARSTTRARAPPRSHRAGARRSRGGARSARESRSPHPSRTCPARATRARGRRSRRSPTGERAQRRAAGGSVDDCQRHRLLDLRRASSPGARPARRPRLAHLQPRWAAGPRSPNPSACADGLATRRVYAH